MSPEAETCVVIPHYGETSELLVSLQSIMEERAVAVVVVDDGSPSAPQLAELERVCHPKTRLSLILLGANHGIETALNHGLRFVLDRGYGFIGRLDSGDTVAPNRFAKQQQYMDAQALDICGTWVDFVSDSGERLFTLRHPVDHAEILRSIKMYNPFVHPSVMMRRDYVLRNGFYPADYPALEDWAYFMRGRMIGRMGNMPEVLTSYVVSPNSISSRRRLRQSVSKLKLQLAYFEINRESVLGLARSLLVLLFPRNLLTALKGRIHGPR
ncbi:MAG: glycosyltransferase [Thauera sp.]|nr:glycosyltransferase [Thauera sp.]